MTKVFKYSHLATKIRAMQGKMLTDEDFEHLANATSIKDIALYLKNHTYYKDNFQDIDEDEVHRGDLEVILYRALIKDALKIARYLKGKEKTLYRYVYRKQEVEDLKKMIRTLQVGKPLSSINRQTLFIGRQSNIDFNVSLQAKNIRELVDTLKGTNFYGILKPLIQEDTRINMFSAEMALDMYYYNQLYIQIKKTLSGKDAEVMQMSYGLDADFRNMMWIYRAKKYYSLSKERIFTYLIPGGYKLKRQHLIDLVEARDSVAVMDLLKKGPYGNIIDYDSGHWGNGFYRYSGYKQRTNIRQLPFTIAPIIGYIFLKEIEIVNLTTIIEGVRYRVSPKEVQAYVAKRNS